MGLSDQHAFYFDLEDSTSNNAGELKHWSLADYSWDTVSLVAKRRGAQRQRGLGWGCWGVYVAGGKGAGKCRQKAHKQLALAAQHPTRSCACHPMLAAVLTATPCRAWRPACALGPRVPGGAPRRGAACLPRQRLAGYQRRVEPSQQQLPCAHCASGDSSRRRGRCFGRGDPVRRRSADRGPPAPRAVRQPPRGQPARGARHAGGSLHACMHTVRVGWGAAAWGWGVHSCCRGCWQGVGGGRGYGQDGVRTHAAGIPNGGTCWRPLPCSLAVVPSRGST